MATFKPIVKNARSDGFYKVYIQVVHNRKNLRIKTSKMIDKRGLDKDRNIKDTVVLAYCMNKINEYQAKLNKLIIDNWTVKEVVEYLQKQDEDISFSEYARKFKFSMAKKGQERNARNYELAYQHLERFAGTNQLMFSRFTTSFIQEWIKSLETTSRAKEMYPVCVRQIFKQAVLDYNDYDRDIILIKTNPWLKVKIPKADIPEKRAIPAEECKRFFELAIPESKLKTPQSEIAQDVAMMIICLAGINTADIYHLEKDRCTDGIIRYNRKKTRKFRADKSYIEIRIPDKIKPLIEKYKTAGNDPYLLSFHNLYSSEDSFNANVNSGLRSICKHYAIDSYCCYTFRHTFATVARNDCGFTDEQVAFAMNHASAHRVTRGYIKTDYSPISDLNEAVIDYIFNGKKREAVISNKIEDTEQKSSGLSRFFARHMMSGTAYYKGKKIHNITDIGFNNIEEIIQALVKFLPSDIPNHEIVLFKIENLDNDEYEIYKRMKGKGFK